MAWQLTGKRKHDGKVIKITRPTKSEAKIQLTFAKRYGATNLKIRKVKYGSKNLKVLKKNKER